jgi:hypothetical protein
MLSALATDARLGLPDRRISVLRRRSVSIHNPKWSVVNGIALAVMLRDVGRCATGGVVTENVGQIWTRPSLLLAFASFVLHALANGHYGILHRVVRRQVCPARCAPGGRPKRRLNARLKELSDW